MMKFMATNSDICGFIEGVGLRGFCKLSLYLARFSNLIAGFVVILLATLDTKNRFRVVLNAEFVFIHDRSKDVNNSQIIAAYSF
jgi:hypothetical protein